MSMSGIPAIWVMATALIPVPAPSTIQLHATTRAATTTKRSRRSTPSRTVVSVTVIAVTVPSGATKLLFILVIGVEQAVLVPGDVRQRAVTAAQVEFDG